MKQRPLPVASAYAPWSDAALFEVSWEVCNQVGGIYQVLRSTARTMVQRWGDRYLVVGPHVLEDRTQRRKVRFHGHLSAISAFPAPAAMPGLRV